jgi:hypothetical protein
LLAANAAGTNDDADGFMVPMKGGDEYHDDDGGEVYDGMDEEEDDSGAMGMGFDENDELVVVVDAGSSIAVVIASRMMCALMRTSGGTTG